MPDWNPNKGGSESTRRRSQRAILSLPVTVRTEGASKEGSFDENTHTLVVNAHGALIAISGKVEKGQSLRVMNRTTNEARSCRVVYVGVVPGEKTQVGIEFNEPSPDFWRISFPPDNWVPPDQEPAGRKVTK